MARCLQTSPPRLPLVAMLSGLIHKRVDAMTIDVTAAPRQVPFLDLMTVHQELSSEILKSLASSLKAGAFVGGAEVEQFEAEFANYVGTRYALGVSNGTDALRLAYMAMELRPGDEVITVPNTFIATTEALTQSGA